MKKIIIYCKIGLITFTSIDATPRQDSQYSNVYYSHKTTFHEARDTKQKCMFIFHTNTFLKESYFNFKTIMSLTLEQGIKSISKTLYTLGKLKLEQKRLKKDTTNPEGYVWDALLTKYIGTNPEEIALVNNLQLLTSHIYAIDKEMADLLYTMNSLGHENRVTSNIGKPSLTFITQSFKKPTGQNSKAFDYCINIILGKHATLPCEKNNWLSPQQQNFYPTLIKKNKSNKSKIYIDKNRKNVIAAVESGFDIGIVFKNQDNLIKIFKDLSINTPETISQ